MNAQEIKLASQYPVKRTIKPAKAGGIQEGLAVDGAAIQPRRRYRA